MINTFTELFICYITGTCVLCTCQNMRCHNPIEIMRVLCVASSTNYSYTHLSIYTYMYIYIYIYAISLLWTGLHELGRAPAGFTVPENVRCSITCLFM